MQLSNCIQLHKHSGGQSQFAYNTWLACNLVYSFLYLYFCFDSVNGSIEAGCKKNHFYSLPFLLTGKLKLAFTTPNVISASPRSFLTSRIDFTVLFQFEFLKKHHLPVRQVKNRIHQPGSNFIYGIFRQT